MQPKWVSTWWLSLPLEMWSEAQKWDHLVSLVNVQLLTTWRFVWIVDFNMHPGHNMHPLHVEYPSMCDEAYYCAEETVLHFMREREKEWVVPSWEVPWTRYCTVCFGFMGIKSLWCAVQGELLSNCTWITNHLTVFIRHCKISYVLIAVSGLNSRLEIVVWSLAFKNKSDMSISKHSYRAFYICLYSMQIDENISNLDLSVLTWNNSSWLTFAWVVVGENPEEIGLVWNSDIHLNHSHQARAALPAHTHIYRLLLSDIMSLHMPP